MLKAALLDLDCTLTTKDISTVLAEMVGKAEESHQLDLDFQTGVSKGLTGLIDRINLLHGLSVGRIQNQLSSEDYLMPGAEELIDYCRSKRIVTILGSGNTIPVLEYYQQKLGIDYIVGSRPHIKDGAIDHISEADYPDSDFKLYGSKKILGELEIQPTETVAIGDGMGDKSRFKFAGLSIAINPTGGIEKYADYVIKDDVSLAIPIIEQRRNL